MNDTTTKKRKPYLHPTHVAILLGVGRGNIGMTMKDLCTALVRTSWDGSPSSTIRGAVRTLCNNGYLRGDSGTPRYYYLTDDGKAALLEIGGR